MFKRKYEILYKILNGNVGIVHDDVVILSAKDESIESKYIVLNLVHTLFRITSNLYLLKLSASKGLYDIKYVSTVITSPPLSLIFYIYIVSPTNAKLSALYLKKLIAPNKLSQCFRFFSCALGRGQIFACLHGRKFFA